MRVYFEGSVRVAIYKEQLIVTFNGRNEQVSRLETVFEYRTDWCVYDRARGL